MQTLQVQLAERSYPIYIGAGLLAQTAMFVPHIAGRQVAVITNETVAPLYLPRLIAGFKKRWPGVEIRIRDGEQQELVQALTAVPASPRSDAAAGAGVDGLPASLSLQQLSQAAIDQALQAARGNMSQAARQLGISRQTLYRKLKMPVA